MRFFLHYIAEPVFVVGLNFHKLQIVDFAVDHPSCSKQHAVLQYRLVEYIKEDGRKGRRVK